MDTTLFGAVRELDNNSVRIPDEVRTFLANEVTALSALPNTAKRSYDLANVGLTDKDASLLRAQVKQYAKDHNLAYSLPDETKFESGLNSGTVVTFRFAPHQDKSKKSGPVTVIRAAK